MDKELLIGLLQPIEFKRDDSDLRIVGLHAPCRGIRYAKIVKERVGKLLEERLELDTDGVAYGEDGILGCETCGIVSRDIRLDEHVACRLFLFKVGSVSEVGDLERHIEHVVHPVGRCEAREEVHAYDVVGTHVDDVAHGEVSDNAAIDELCAVIVGCGEDTIIAILLRVAKARSPLSSTTASPLAMSVAMQRNGMSRSLKSLTLKTGKKTSWRRNIT